MANKAEFFLNGRPSLCVVVCVHNAPDYTELCLESVLLNTRMPYDLVIVNDGSAEKTTALLEKFAATYPHIRMIRHEKAMGYTKAANAGLKASSADYTILLNSDTVTSPGWADRIMRCGESEPVIGIVGPLSNAATYQSVPFVFDERGHWKQNELNGNITVAHYGHAIASISMHYYPRVPVANGFCFAVKRQVIQAIGYLDEETFPFGYGEENDYCIRATDAGFEIAVADDAYVYHATSKSFGVKAREKLTQHAHHAIRSKYSDDRLSKIDHALRNNHGMDQVRKRVVDYVHHARNAALAQTASPSLPKANQNLAFLFLLPDCSAKAGGTQVIVETARGLAAMDVPVRIAAKQSIKEEYDLFFPFDSNLFFYYTKPAELLREAAQYEVVIATIFHSTRLLKEILARCPYIMPAYYVQDYEPWFLDEHPALKEEALASYTLIPHMHLFGISPWVQQIVSERHDVTVHKILGSLDQQLFYPDFSPRSSETLTVSAMVRPSTPWRGPVITMKVLRALKAIYGETIEVTVFGCEDDQIERHDLPRDFVYTNYGVLTRPDVAAVLRSSDVFLDLSSFQAFGRTALEAMASGAAVVAPQFGGVSDFGVSGENILMVDTEDEKACISAACSLINDHTMRHRFRINGINRGLDYSIQRSTLSFLSLMYELKYISEGALHAAA